MSDSTDHQNKGLKYSLARADLAPLSDATVADTAENGPDNTWRQAAADEMVDRK